MVPKVKKLPMECSKKELEAFLAHNGKELPSGNKDLMTYHYRLVELAETILRDKNRAYIEFKTTGLKKRFGQLKDIFGSKRDQEVYDYCASTSTENSNKHSDLLDFGLSYEKRSPPLVDIENIRSNRGHNFPTQVPDEDEDGDQSEFGLLFV